MAAIGNERKFDESGWIGYGPRGSDGHNLYVCPPFDGKPATFGNGMMIAFTAPSEDAVRAAYAAGLEFGGKDEGAPGYRPPDKQSWYGAYLRDPVGNKVCVFVKS
jgi:hypothetical protein